MKALVYEGPWRMALAELPEPVPGPGEVLLRSLAVGICGSDVHGFTGESGRRKPGMVMGHEAVGEVVALGPGATRFRKGDRVAVYNIHACGNCRYCAAEQEQLCPDKKVLGVNAGKWGAMAEYFTFPETGLFKLPRTLDPAIGVLAEPIAVGVHALNLMRPEPDHTLAIVGAGTIGLGLAIAAKAHGMRHVYAFDKVPEKLALVEAFGALPFNVDHPGAVADVRARTSGRGVDGVFEAVGTSATVRMSYDLCALSGTLVLIGNIAQEFTLPLQGVTSNETVIRGSYGFTKKDFAVAVGIAGNGSIALDRLISGSCSLGETPEIMSRLGKGTLHAIKMIVRP